MESCGYCICFVEQPANRALAEKLITEISTYTLPKKMYILAEEVQYKTGRFTYHRWDSINKEQLDILSGCRWLLIICNKEDRNSSGISQAINYFAANKKRFHTSRSS